MNTTNTHASLKGLMIALLALLLPFAVHARIQPGIGAVEIDITDARGRTLSQYPLHRQAPSADTYRAYVEASAGQRYAIRVHNRSPRRVGLVIAVDGRNIISGQKSYLRRQERMYILEPYQQATYRGWRTGKERINEFYFTEAENSYAGAWGDHTAMGVIAVAVYPERQDYRSWGQERNQERMEPRSARPFSQPGTGFGDQRRSPSRRVEFEPAKAPLAKYFIKYEWREALCRKGIASCPQPGNRFWNHRENEYGYAPYPPPKYPHPKYYRD